MMFECWTDGRHGLMIVSKWQQWDNQISWSGGCSSAITILSTQVKSKSAFTHFSTQFTCSHPWPLISNLANITTILLLKWGTRTILYHVIHTGPLGTASILSVRMNLRIVRTLRMTMPSIWSRLLPPTIFLMLGMGIAYIAR